LGALERELKAHTIIGVDTAPFIYFWEHNPHYYPLSETLFQHLKKPTVQGITSIITLIEVCVLPRRQGRLDLVQTYERALLYSRQVQTLPINAGLARQAVILRAEYSIRVPDALQIAAALGAGATAFVTNDRQLVKVQEIDVLLFDDYAA
jgi:predicted nucleic acid-binding protein